MARKGRTTEKIVENLEKLFVGSGAIVTSPDFIFDSIAKIKREVDISVRSRIGSHEILIIIECRDRPSSPKEDVTWIEQLKTKAENINANKTVAVVTTGFSKAAIKKAKIFGIELRYLKEFNPTEVRDWIDKLTIHSIEQKYEITYVYVGATDADMTKLIDPKKMLPQKSISKQKTKFSDKVFIHNRSGLKYSIDDFIRSISKTLFEEIEPESEAIEKQLHLLFYDPENSIMIKNGNIHQRVFRISIILKLWGIMKIINPDKAFHYSSEEKTLGESVPCQTL